MTHVMLDLETYGVTPGCPVLSIGAVIFEGDDVGEEFYGVAYASQYRIGLWPEDATVEFWKTQSEEARAIFDHPDAMDIVDLLTKFAAWFPKDAFIWGNGAGFDQPILAAAYRAAGIKLPWEFYNERCYRTIKNLAPHIKMSRTGTHHNALNDAQSQATHLLVIRDALGLVLG